MEEIYQFLKENTFFVATIDGDQPRVRPFGAVNYFEGKLYIQTGNVKPVFKQMKANPNVEISACNTTGKWLRLTAKVVQDDRREARVAMLEANPGLKRLYSADDGNCEVLYLTDATAQLLQLGDPDATKEYKF